MALFYYKYNNYNNRRLKRENTLSGYNSYLVYTEVNPNFNPGDGVSTEITVGRDQNAFASEADYVIYSKTGTDITSRWFVMESHFNRSGQYILNLYRDVVADFYDSILDADTFIEKATVLDSSPFIYNKENISVNQIKKSETKIKDESGCPWIVGYLDRKYEGETIPIVSTDVVPDYTVSSLSDWMYYKYINNTCYGERTKTSFNFEMLLLNEGNVYKFANYKDWIGEANTNHDTSYAFTTQFVVNPLYLNAFIEKYKDEVNTNVANYGGLYGNDCLYASNGCFSNITFKSIIKESVTPNIGQQNGAYAVHVDSNNQAEGTCIFNDCIMISDFNAPFGNGLRKNNTVELNNCDLISRQENRGQDFANGGMGALFTHNNHTGTGDNCPNQVLRLNNCRLKSKLKNVIRIQEVTKNNAEAILDINNCLIYSETNGVTGVIKYGNVNSFDEMNIWKLSDTSYGNTVKELNKF